MSTRWAVAPEEIPKPRREYKFHAAGVVFQAAKAARILPAERRNAQPDRYIKRPRRNTSDHRYPS